MRTFYEPINRTIYQGLKIKFAEKVHHGLTVRFRWRIWNGPLVAWVRGLASIFCRRGNFQPTNTFWVIRVEFCGHHHTRLIWTFGPSILGTKEFCCTDFSENLRTPGSQIVNNLGGGKTSVFNMRRCGFCDSPGIADIGSVLVWVCVIEEMVRAHLHLIFFFPAIVLKPKTQQGFRIFGKLTKLNGTETWVASLSTTSVSFSASLLVHFVVLFEAEEMPANCLKKCLCCIFDLGGRKFAASCFF